MAFNIPSFSTTVFRIIEMILFETQQANTTVMACFSLTVLDISPVRNFKGPPTVTPTLPPQQQHALLFLQKCANFNQLKQIHAQLIRNALHHHPGIAAKLIRLCSSYGQLNYAALVFHQIENPTPFAWNLLIRAHTANASPRRAILLFNLMVCQGASIDKFTFPFVMKACLDCYNVDKAKEVYGLSVKTGFCRDLYLNNVLMDLYLKLGLIEDGLKVFDKMRVKDVVSWTTVIAGLVNNGWMDLARKLFDKMPERNVMSWTAMITGYAKSDMPENAFDLFAEMQSDNVMPNEHTLVGLLMACAELGNLRLGRWIHEFAIKNGLEIGVFLGTALIDMYSKCGSLEDAKRVFEALEVKSVATWNAMITCFGVHGRGEEAIAVFQEMERLNVEPDAITLRRVLRACLQIDDTEKGRKYLYYMIGCYGVKPSFENYAYL